MRSFLIRTNSHNCLYSWKCPQEGPHALQEGKLASANNAMTLIPLYLFHCAQRIHQCFKIHRNLVPPLTSMNRRIQSGVVSLVVYHSTLLVKRFTIGAVKQIVCNFSKLFIHAPITPNFPSGSSHEIVGDYVEIQMLAHHFSHSYSRRCRWMVLGLTGVISPSLARIERYEIC